VPLEDSAFLVKREFQPVRPRILAGDHDRVVLPAALHSFDEQSRDG
jgi:hypothetical protein